MGIFNKIYYRFLFFFILFGKVSNALRHLLEYIAESKWGKFFLRYRLFSGIPIVILSYTVHNLRGQIKAIEEERDEINIENNILKEQVINQFRTFNDIPAPIWSKLKVGDGGYIVLRVNDSYYFTMMYPMGLKRTAYIGQNDEKIYTEEIAAIFRKEDSVVAYGGETLITLNRLRDSIKNINKDLLIMKWRKIEMNGDTLVLGQAIDIGNVIKDIEKELVNDNK